MTRLHQLLSTSPAALRDCVNHCGTGDQVLLADQGVLLLTEADRVRKLRDACDGNIACLTADTQARGLLAAAERLGVAAVEDATWVDMAVAHAAVLSWT